MGWNDLDKSSGQKAPLLNARDCTQPTRIRLISGPGRYSEPEQIWQHWAPEGAGMPPVMCIGERNGCIFHDQPLAWRLGKTNVMNAIHYTPNGSGGWDAKIVVLQAPATLLTQIRDQSRNVNIDPTTVDWIISKSGQGKEGTKYNAVLAPGLPIHGTASIDLTQWPAQEEGFANPNVPQLVDYDRIEGFQPMSAAEQEAWFDKVAENVQKKKSGAQPGAPAAPAAPAAGSVPPVAPPPAAPAAPPAPAPAPAPQAAPAPPPAAATAPLPSMPPAAPPAPAPAAPAAPAAPNPLDAAKALPDPWNQGRTMGALAPHELKFIVDKAASFAGFQSQLQAAKMLLEAAPAAAAATPPAAGGDQAALKTQMEQLMQSMPIFQDFQIARSFFEKVTGKKSLKSMSAEELQKLVSIALQGDDAVRTASAG